MNTKTEAPKKAEAVKSLPGAKNVNPANDEKKANAMLAIEKFKPEPIKTAQERILRKNQFVALAKRYEHLKEKDNELKTFHAGNDKTSAKIIFKNAQGFEFSIQNTNVIDKLTQAAKDELNVLLAEAENEVLTFEI